MSSHDSLPKGFFGQMAFLGKAIYSAVRPPPEEKEEPPRVHLLAVNGVEHLVTANDSLSFPQPVPEVFVEIRSTRLRRFDRMGVRFDYPDCFQWETDLSDPFTKFYELEGPGLFGAKLQIIRFHARLDVGEFVTRVRSGLKEMGFDKGGPEEVSTRHFNGFELKGLRYTDGTTGSYGEPWHEVYELPTRHAFLLLTLKHRVNGDDEEAMASWENLLECLGRSFSVSD